MKVFINDSFKGHWPVGTSAVVSAVDAVEAAKLLETALAQQGLAQRIEPTDMTEVDITKPSVQIISNGDY